MSQLFSKPGCPFRREPITANASSLRARLGIPLSVVFKAVLVFACVLTGCSKSTQDSAPQASKSPTPILKFHWLGKEHLQKEANATNFMAIWNLPESARLEAQTLDKLATAPWRLWQTNVAVSNAPTAQLRPLLADLLNYESYLEVVGDTNTPWEAVLALRLPADRDALWRSNLPVVLGSLYGANFTVQSEHPTAIFQLPTSTLALVRSNDWTLVASQKPGIADSLLNQFCARLADGPAPYPTPTTNYIVASEFRGAALSNWLPALVPAIAGGNLLVFGDGENLRTRGEITFAAALNVPLEPWHVPTNLIHAPLVSFAALRGVAPWLESREFWKAEQFGKAPNQLFGWAQTAPWLHFFAARCPAPAPTFLALKDYVLTKVNPALAPNRTGEFTWQTNESKLVWKGVPFCNPVFQQQDDLVVGGFTALPPSSRPAPPEFLQQLERDPNLLYYDWELTGSQSPSWTQILQLMRMSFARAQLSITNAAMPWLNTAGTNLDYTVTTVTLAGDRQLSFARASTIGFNSLELQLLVDWLDSPDFPRGLHTFVAPRDLISLRRPPGL